MVYLLGIISAWPWAAERHIIDTHSDFGEGLRLRGAPISITIHLVVGVHVQMTCTTLERQRLAEAIPALGEATSAVPRWM